MNVYFMRVDGNVHHDLFPRFNGLLELALAARGCIGSDERIEQSLAACACEAANAMGYSFEHAACGFIMRGPGVHRDHYPEGVTV